MKGESAQYEEPHDLINHPPYYTFAPDYEVISVIEAWNLDYHLGNVIKYVARAGRKGDKISDLKKAKWYIERAIDVERGD